MYAMTTAAELLGVTPKALAAALARGETVLSLTKARGLDTDRMVEAVVDSESADVAALATIAGFAPDDVELFSRELRAYLVAFVTDGEDVADRLFDEQVLQPV
ncbi:hypothetical protein [Jiangella asiatica]|uniref:Uncharacterized protein n=1 Tax=Jiangella asiatica TaxID=2530372 RepID=A0A4R5D992_9ACTN|nr:hypothetical protein [Jiangella asiatica]TDE10139.1 hypothetical protein E1269_12545 [Jiangella asiatica]